jgi:hypothetical protein
MQKWRVLSSYSCKTRYRILNLYSHKGKCWKFCGNITINELHQKLFLTLTFYHSKMDDTVHE